MKQETTSAALLAQDDDYKEDGTIRKEESYVDGKPEGRHVAYIIGSRGNYTETKNYKNGNRIYVKMYNDDGTVKYQDGIE